MRVSLSVELNSSAYMAAHNWIRRHYGAASQCENPDCQHKTTRYEWANKSGKYLRRRSDWVMLCRSCHRRYDYGNVCKNGHEFTDKNTYIKSGGNRMCRECHRLRQERYRHVRKDKGVLAGAKRKSA